MTSSARRFAPLAFSFTLTWSRAAIADEPKVCGGPGHPGVALRAEGLDPELRASIVTQLRASLAGRSLELCDAEGSEGAVAELDISGAASAVALSLAVRDEITDKRVSREVDLRRIPEDGRALTIAQAADELLRASWAELLVADAPRPRRDVPPEIARAVEPPASEPPVVRPLARTPVAEVGAVFAIERYGSGATQLGPDVALGFFPLARLGLGVRGGLRTGARSEVAAGSVDPSSITGALVVLVALLPRTGRVGADVGPELSVTRVRYEAEANAGARARSESGTAVYAAAVARGWLAIAPPLRVTLGLAVGAPIHAVRAVAVDSTIASISGVLLGAQAGIGGVW